MNDADFFLVQYEHPNRGKHRVVGVATRTFYGYVGKGARFYAHKADIAAQPDIYVRIADTEKAPAAQKTVQPEAPKPIAAKKPTPTKADVQEEVQPVDLEDENRYNLQNVPGITSGIERQLNAAGVHSIEELNALDVEKLEALKGVGPARASIIKEFVAQQLGQSDQAQED